MKWIILEALQVVIVIIIDIIHHIEKRRVKGPDNGSLKCSHDLTSRHRHHHHHHHHFFWVAVIVVLTPISLRIQS